jgi:hypothetical protein
LKQAAISSITTPMYKRAVTFIMKPMFVPLTKQEELALLRNDDEQFSKTASYLDGLIRSALDRFSFSTAVFRRIHKALLRDVAVAARRFLDNPKNINSSYRFSTYFTWYISERLKQESVVPPAT